MAGISADRVQLPPIAPGLLDALVTVQVDGQGERRARLWYSADERPRAIIVFLHGAVVRDPRSRRLIDAEAQTDILLHCLAAPALGRMHPVIVLPFSAQGEWWHRHETSYVLGLVRAIAERWPSARTRRVVAGYSNGGIGAWYFARLYSDDFDRALSLAGNAEIIGPSRIPVDVIHGTHDELFPIESVRDAVERAARASPAPVILRERRGASHLDPCAYAAELAAATAGMAER